MLTLQTQANKLNELQRILTLIHRCQNWLDAEQHRLNIPPGNIHWIMETKFQWLERFISKIYVRNRLMQYYFKKQNECATTSVALSIKLIDQYNIDDIMAKTQSELFITDYPILYN